MRHVTPASLTRREVEILRLLARVHSNAEMARDLYISLATVKYHVSNLLAKLGCSSRTELVAWCHDVGVVAPKPSRWTGVSHRSGR